MGSVSAIPFLRLCWLSNCALATRQRVVRQTHKVLGKSIRWAHFKCGSLLTSFSSVAVFGHAKNSCQQFSETASVLELALLTWPFEVSEFLIRHPLSNAPESNSSSLRQWLCSLYLLSLHRRQIVLRSRRDRKVRRPALVVTR